MFTKCFYTSFNKDIIVQQENQDLQRKLDVKEREIKHLHGVIRNLKGIYTCKNLTACSNTISTGHQQVVFALLAPSCQEVWNKLSTICNICNLIDIIRLVAGLFQQI